MAKPVALSVGCWTGLRAKYFYSYSFLMYVVLIANRQYHLLLERFSIAFTANGKRQAEISRLPKTREIYLFSAYILPVSHSYGASTKNREIS